MAGIMHKISDKLHGNKDDTTVDNTTGSSTTGTHGTTSTTGSSGITGAHDTTGAHGTTGTHHHGSHHGTTTEEAPVVKERIHEHTDHVDKTKREDLHEKTNIVQTVQPIVDEQRDATRTRTEHHGTEVHEHGKGGLDDRTARELQERREHIQGQHDVTVDHSSSERRERPDTHHTEKTNTIEQVVPVVERDVYRPEVVEHKKKEVHIHHDAPHLEGTRVAPAVTIDQYKQQAP